MAKTGQSKKVGCPAKLIMVEAICFDEHDITPEMTQKKVAKICEDISEELRPYVTGTNDQKRKKAQAQGGQTIRDIPQRGEGHAGSLPKYSKRIYVRFPSHLAHRFHFPEVSKMYSVQEL